MLSFVNAKINIGLNIIRKREDGYHDLETFFYPVGKYCGSHRNPDSFCDILEIVPDSAPVDAAPFKFVMTGREVDCTPEDNLVFKAANLFRSSLRERGVVMPRMSVHLEKHLPDGAGMGGGSADASFTLKMLNSLCDSPFNEKELENLSLKLGADCPFFIADMPAFAEGVGESLSPLKVDLSGLWLAIIKPDLYISTRQAFAGIAPKIPELPLKEALKTPLSNWRNVISNDFEVSLFPQFPILKRIKDSLYVSGAIYASMTGSGSSIYGIFKGEDEARSAVCYAKSAADLNPSAFSSVLLL